MPKPLRDIIKEWWAPLETAPVVPDGQKSSEAPHEPARGASNYISRNRRYLKDLDEAGDMGAEAAEDVIPD